ncbi:MAG: polymer-forming cytoskeletal protein [Spirochaetota bacterium]|nr:polymer-forming cytoskeletal protein [Spirochaetota bacterium]
MPHRIKNTENIIGENSIFEGSLTLSGALRIDGTFSGEELNIEHITIGKTGKVKSQIKSHSIVIEGTVLGNINSTTRTMLLPTAKILGNISTPELIIQNGVIWDGHCLISNSDNNDISQIIIDSFNE